MPCGGIPAGIPYGIYCVFAFLIGDAASDCLFAAVGTKSFCPMARAAMDLRCLVWCSLICMRCLSSSISTRSISSGVSVTKSTFLRRRMVMKVMMMQKTISIQYKMASKMGRSTEVSGQVKYKMTTMMCQIMLTIPIKSERTTVGFPKKENIRTIVPR
ncbi:hypothetical protein FGO68_gene8087 [Halteria grandinella]|uniref:Uncharacterized protein n=1 Tax=Halteria grandinella TaxID=5974 RepID=A0A8J8N9P5_HALGN|nr:hypothetical protein FGO68_gene8087 [Halteria grandinella]